MRCNLVWSGSENLTCKTVAQEQPWAWCGRATTCIGRRTSYTLDNNPTSCRRRRYIHLTQCYRRLHGSAEVTHRERIQSFSNLKARGGSIFPQIPPPLSHLTRPCKTIRAQNVHYTCAVTLMAVVVLGRLKNYRWHHTFAQGNLLTFQTHRSSRAYDNHLLYRRAIRIRSKLGVCGTDRLEALIGRVDAHCSKIHGALSHVLLHNNNSGVVTQNGAALLL